MELKPFMTLGEIYKALEFIAEELEAKNYHSVAQELEMTLNTLEYEIEVPK